MEVLEAGYRLAPEDLVSPEEVMSWVLHRDSVGSLLHLYQIALIQAQELSSAEH
jgi:hypothetical protein